MNHIRAAWRAQMGSIHKHIESPEKRVGNHYMEVTRRGCVIIRVGEVGLMDPCSTGNYTYSTADKPWSPYYEQQ